MDMRKNYAEGYFYPNNKKELELLLKSIKNKEIIDYTYSRKEIIGGIVPHAGYIYSAPEAIHFFEILHNCKKTFDTIIIINPNHTGRGKSVSLSSYKYWATMYGKVEVDKEFQNLLDIPEDDSAHEKEHSGEVMLPLLKYYLNYDFKIVPICFKNQNYENSKVIAKKLYDAAERSKKKILLIASSDFSHYIEADLGKRLDALALEKISGFDSENLENLVCEKDLTICGYGPIMVLMEYAKLKYKNPKTQILRRGNSGETTGDYRKVVDYNSVLFYSE